MLRPNKHSDPQSTLLPIAATILARLTAVRVERFHELRARTSETHPGSERLFIPAVNLLFLLGVVQYRRKTDSFEVVSSR